jgi:hypothetical protein
VDIYIGKGRFVNAQNHVRPKGQICAMVMFSHVLLKESQAKHKKRVEESKGTLLPGLGLAFGLSKIG